MIIDTYFLSTYVFPLASMLLVGASAVALIRVHFALGGDAIDSTLAAGRQISSEIEALRQVCEDTLSRQAEIASRFAVIEQKVEAIGRIERLVVEPVGRSTAIEHATRLAKGGASIDELTRSCGLNPGEASLMRRLHGHAPPPPS